MKRYGRNDGGTSAAAAVSSFPEWNPSSDGYRRIVCSARTIVRHLLFRARADTP